MNLNILIVLVFALVASVYAKKSKNTTETVADDQNTLIDCAGGYAQYIQCAANSTGCAVNDQKCACGHASQIIDICLADTNMNTSNSTCALDKIDILRNEYISNATTACLNAGYQVDQLVGRSGSSATSVSLLILIASLFALLG